MVEGFGARACVRQYKGKHALEENCTLPRDTLQDYMILVSY